MSPEELQAAVARVKYPGYKFVVKWWLRRVTVHATFMAPDTCVGGVLQKTREWIIDKDATIDEVVATCMKLVLTSVEHEARGSFKFDDLAIYGPHTDLSALMLAAKVTTRLQRVEAIQPVADSHFGGLPAIKSGSGPVIVVGDYMTPGMRKSADSPAVLKLDPNSGVTWHACHPCVPMSVTVRPVFERSFWGGKQRVEVEGSKSLLRDATGVPAGFAPERPGSHLPPGFA